MMIGRNKFHMTTQEKIQLLKFLLNRKMKEVVVRMQMYLFKINKNSI